MKVLALGTNIKYEEVKFESIHLNSAQMKLQEICCHLYSEFMTIRESTVAADNRVHFLETMFPARTEALSLLELEAGMLRIPRATLLSFGYLVLSRVVESEVPSSDSGQLRLSERLADCCFKLLACKSWTLLLPFICALAAMQTSCF